MRIIKTLFLGNEVLLRLKGSIHQNDNSKSYIVKVHISEDVQHTLKNYIYNVEYQP